MNPRPPTNGPRPAARKPQSKKPQHWFSEHHHNHHDWYDYDWYDYDWYDYDWYDYYYTYLAPNQSKRPMAPKSAPPRAENTSVDSYQQGFRDGWAAAMDYMIYGVEMSKNMPTPPPPPVPVVKSPDATEE